MKGCRKWLTVNTQRETLTSPHRRADPEQLSVIYTEDFFSWKKMRRGFRKQPDGFRALKWKH